MNLLLSLFLFQLVYGDEICVSFDIPNYTQSYHAVLTDSIFNGKPVYTATHSSGLDSMKGTYRWCEMSTISITSWFMIPDSESDPCSTNYWYGCLPASESIENCPNVVNCVSGAALTTTTTAPSPAPTPLPTPAPSRVPTPAPSPGILWREDQRCGSYHHTSDKSIAHPFQTAICDASSNIPCCSTSNSCISSATAGCYINYASVSGECYLEDTIRMPEFCHITPLDKVGEEIAEQMLWNAAGALLGAIPFPLVGELFDTMFAILDPISPVTSQFSLINNLIDGVNEKIEELQRCMNQKITNSEVRVLSAQLTGMNKAQECKELRGIEKRDCIQNLWFDFRGAIHNIFGKTYGMNEVTEPYLQYEKMLPVFQAVYPVVMGTLTTRLQYLKADNDGCNFNPTLELGKRTAQLLYDWIDTAKNVISEQLKPPSGWNGDCQPYETKMDEYYTIYTNKDYLYAHQYFKRGDDCNSNPVMDVWLTTTKATDYKCKFSIPHTWICSATWADKCDHMKRIAKIFVDSLNSRVDNEYKPQFYNRYITNIKRYRDSLNNVAPMTCSSGQALSIGEYERKYFKKPTQTIEPKIFPESKPKPDNLFNIMVLKTVGVSVFTCIIILSFFALIMYMILGGFGKSNYKRSSLSAYVTTEEDV